MCDSTILGHINDVVEEFISEQKMFTAYDVTLKVREIVGKGVSVRHNEIKNDIHGVMSTHLGGDWNRELVQVVSGKEPAFVYHYFMDDPHQYPSQKNPSSSSSNSSSSLNDDDDDDSDNSLCVGREQKDRSRLLIPASFMKYLGVKGGDIVRVYKEIDFIVVSQEDQNLSELAALKVDKHGYLYLSERTLNKGNLGDAQNFDVSACNSRVEVKEAT